MFKTAFQQGATMIDLSVCYKNEENIGKALKRIYDEKIVNRSDIFIILKMMPFKEVILQEKL